MLRVNKNNCTSDENAKNDFSNAIDNFIIMLWKKSNSLNLKDVITFVNDHVDKICVKDVTNVKYSELKLVTRMIVNEFNLDRSRSTELMIIDEIYTLSCLYNAYELERDDF